MGPVHKPQSTRARRGRSVRTTSKHRRKLAPPKPSKLRTGAKVLRNARERQADATLRIARAAEPARASAESPLDQKWADELYGIRRKLKLIQSCTIVVEHLLKEQNCNLDSDAAAILGTHVTDSLHIQIGKIDGLLGNPLDDDDIEEESP
jgi:hypothetical protein